MLKLNGWVPVSDKLPLLEFKQGVVKVSKRVLIYREEYNLINIGWLHESPKGNKSWRTQNEVAIPVDEVDYWHELPEIPA